MILKPVTPKRGAEILENASGYIKDSLLRVGPNVTLPRHFTMRLERELRRVADQLRIFDALDKAGCISWPTGDAKAEGRE